MALVLSRSTPTKAHNLDFRMYGYKNVRIIQANTQAYNQQSGWYDALEKYSDPNWQVKIKAGQNASQPYLRREFFISEARVACTTNVNYPGDTNNPYWGTQNLCWTGALPGITQGLTDSVLADQALTKLKRKMARRTQSYEALVPLAEIRDLRTTIRGMVDLTSNVVGALADVRKGRFKGSWKKVSQIWLLYSFGVSPMMREISSLSDSITAYLNRHDSVDRLTGSANKVWRSGSKGTITTGPLGAEVVSDMEATHELSYKYIAGHKFTLMSDTNYGVASHFGFSPPRLIPALWELIAFSWVIDYFTTVGDLLDDTFSGSTGNSVYVVENRRYTVDSKSPVYYRTAMSNASIISQSKDTAVLKYFEFARTLHNTLPPRVLRFRTRDEIGLFAVTKLLNLTSVLANFR